MSKDLENWACVELDKLGLPDAGVIIQYLGPLQKPEEVENYLSSMLDISDKAHREFIRDFLERQADSKVDKRFYRKKDDTEEQHIARPQGKKKGKEKTRSTASSESVSSNERNKTVVQLVSENNGSDDKENASKSESQQKGKKKKNKFVNLYTDNDVVMLSGRNVCECLATKHNLINNCLSCGRIVCEQEGAGPCFFCGNVVKTKMDNEVQGPQPQTQTDKKNAKGKNLSVKNIAADMKKAVDHKNKLLEYDRTSEKRTKVLDDECDYFNSNSKWITKEDRELLQARENELREKKYDLSNRNITIDLLGRKLVSEEVTDTGIFDPDDPVVKAILEKQQNDIFTDYQNHNLPPPAALIKPVYMSDKKEDDRSKFCVNSLVMSPTSDVANHINRLQDRELQEMTDQGKCLSMHQPWASLLIAGIKVHEGRTWYSSHRGRLWIASASKVPTIKDIEDLENFHRMWGPDDSQITFPKHYPPGCLLGCVDVVDVLPQEEYRLKYPEGESDSPFVFICERPREMIFKFPTKGQHKIFGLDSKVHQAAKKALK